MRTIKFRGEKEFTNEWLVGSLLSVAADEHFIFPEEAPHSYNEYRVNSETVGQFTGLLDKNGKEIYEGDIVKTKGNWGGIVTWNSRGYFYINDGYYTEEPDLLPLGSLNCYVRRDIEIVGNIHDNPELLKNND